MYLPFLCKKFVLIIIKMCQNSRLNNILKSFYSFIIKLAAYEYFIAVLMSGQKIIIYLFFLQPNVRFKPTQPKFYYLN